MAGDELLGLYWTTSGPAEGEFPIRAYVAALRDAGYAGPWGVEVLSEDLRALPIEEIFDCASATSRAQLD